MNDYVLTPEMNQALIHLARRINPLSKGWWKAGFSAVHANYVTLYCCICNQSISYDSKIRSKHGLQHLKEHNLSSFL